MAHLSTLNSEEKVSFDPTLAINTATSDIGRQVHLFPGRPCPGFPPPAIVPNTTRGVSRSGVARCPPIGLRQKETALADNRLKALASCIVRFVCFLEGSGVRHTVIIRRSLGVHTVVGAMSAAENNDPEDELAVCAVECNGVLHAETSQHTHRAESPSRRTFACAPETWTKRSPYCTGSA